MNPRCKSPTAPKALLKLCESFPRYSAYASDSSKILSGGKFGEWINDKVNVGGVELEKMQMGLGGGNEVGKPLNILGAFGVGKGGDMVGVRLKKLGKTKSSAVGIDLGSGNKSGTTRLCPSLSNHV